VVPKERFPASLSINSLALLSLFACGTSAVASDVLAPPPPVSTVPDAVQENQDSNPMQVFGPAPSVGELPQILQWGQLTLHPHVDYQLLYGNGIASSPGQQQNTVVQEVAPGMLFKLGQHWSLDYTPTLSFYSDSQFQNSLDQSAQLAWGSGVGDWFLKASQGYSISSDPTIETAAQTDRENYSTALDATYEVNQKISLSFDLSQNLENVGNTTTETNLLQQLTDSRSWSTTEGLNYAFNTRFIVGLSIGLGYGQQDGSPDDINEQCEAQINWRATDKISFQLSGGVQDQQYLSGGAGDLLTPIFSGTIQYQPFKQTRLSLSAGRAVSPSYFQNQNTESTSISATLTQRLLGRLSLAISGGYTTTRYVASLPGLNTSRDDDTYSFTTRLSCPILKHGTFSVFYQYTDNPSSQSGFAPSGTSFAYTSSQIGMEIGYQY
jgi:hypothetical protein